MMKQMVSDEEMRKYLAQPKRPYTQDEIKERRNKIILVRENIKLQGKVPDRLKILNELKKYGHFPSLQELRGDMIEINRDDTFVIDLATHNYKELIEELYENLNVILRDCDDIMGKKWTNSKVISTEVGENNRVLKKQQIITTELAEPKTQALGLKKRIIKLQTEIFKSSIIDISIALMDTEIDKIRQEYDELKEKQNSLSETIDNIKKISKNKQ